MTIFPNASNQKAFLQFNCAFSFQEISGKRKSNKVHGFWTCQNSQDDQNLKKSALKNAVTLLALTFENKALFCLIVVLDKPHLHFE